MKEEERKNLIDSIKVTSTVDHVDGTYILRFEIPYVLIQLGSIGLGRSPGQDLKFIAELMYLKAMDLIKGEG